MIAPSLAPAAAADTQVTLRPAAGPDGTVASLTGRGFQAGRRVEVRMHQKPLATARAGLRGGFRASLIPSGEERSVWRLVSTSGRWRVTSIFKRARRAVEAEVASSTGRRLRWRPFVAEPGAAVRMVGSGFRPRERVRISFLRHVAKLRASPRGRLELALTAPRRAGTRHGAARAGRVSLALSVTIRARDSRKSSPPAPTLVPGAPVDGFGSPLDLPANASGSAVIMAAGDIACDPASPDFPGVPTRCRHRQTANLLSDPAVSGVLPLGDVQYEEGTLAQFMASYDPSWGRRKSITRPVVGNHEYLTPGAAGYFDYFGALAGERGKGYYAFDAGRWRWYVLNSNCSQAGGCGATSPQVAWMTADLQANPRPCVGAAWHHPRFSAAAYSDDAIYEPFWRALYGAGAELVLVGHDHNYQRYTPVGPNGVADPARGIREFVVGTGGRNLQSVVPRSDGLREADNDNTYGVLELTLRPYDYKWRFVPEAGHTYADQGSTGCH